MVKSVPMRRAIKDSDDNEKKGLDKIKELQDSINNSRARRYAWAIAYLYPDIYSPIRLPDKYRLPTHIMTNKKQTTMTIGTSHDFAIYFSPLVDCFYNYQFNAAGELYEGMTNNWSNDAYVSYADNGGSVTSGTSVGVKYVFNSNGHFDNLSNWNNAIKGSTNLKKFRKVRLLGASIKITYTGKNDELSGIVKIAMGIKGFTTPLDTEEVTPEEMVNFPEYKTLSLDKPIVCRYRLSDDDYTDFGPYTPYSTLPYYLIYGKGLQKDSTIFIEMIKHFEGVVVSDEDEFVSPVRFSQAQAPIEEQLKFVEKFKRMTSIEHYDEDIIHDKIKEYMD